MSHLVTPASPPGGGPGPAREAVDWAGDSRPSRRLRVLVPALLILGWLVASGIGGSYFGKLSGVQDNSTFASLPAGTEAAAVQAVEARLTDTNSFPAIVVWTFPGTLDRSTVAALAPAITRLHTVSGLAPGGAVVGPIPARDGTAAEVIVAVDSGKPDTLAATLDSIRAASRTALPAGATVYVTGPAAFTADLSSAFAGLDGKLLVTAFGVVALILVIVYRSPILPFLVLLSAGLALSIATLVVYHLAKAGTVSLNGQSQGILFILAVGATTDYSLLLVARYREELRVREHAWAAMRAALRACREPIGASAGTVVLGLLCLLISRVKTLSAIGPVAAVGIAGSLLVALTFLPAVLVLLGRASFWPFRPQLGTAKPEGAGGWGRVAALVSRRPRRFWLVTAGGLIVLAGFYTTFQANGIAASDLTLGSTEAKTGETVLARHFPAGAGDPAVVSVPVADVARVRAVVAAVPGVSGVVPGAVTAAGVAKVAEGRTLLAATTDDASSTVAAQDTVTRMRGALRAAGLGRAQVGGTAAASLDVRDTTAHDRDIIIPTVLLLIFVVLSALLRSLLLPLLVVVANVLSYGATIGLSALFFDHVFHFSGSDPSIPLIGFVFLVALGVDYSIFLMTRTREETLRRGSTRAGIRAGLAETGGVITSAGVVLAATFTALAVIPVIFLAEVGFIVASGVLIDTFLVRTLLLPALAEDVGRRIWWPSRLARPVAAAVGGRHLAGPGPAPRSD